MCAYEGASLTRRVASLVNAPPEAGLSREAEAEGAADRPRGAERATRGEGQGGEDEGTTRRKARRIL